MEDEAKVDDSKFQAEVSQRSMEVAALLQKKDKAGALAKALENPPLWAKTAEVKEANAKIVESCLSQITDSEMAGLIEKLDSEACDTFMKYVYYFMERSHNCPSMLKTHALLSEKGGLGSIVRTLTDRKTVW